MPLLPRSVACLSLTMATVLLPAMVAAATPSADAVITLQPDAAGPAVSRAVLGGHNFGNWMPVTEFPDPLAAVPAGSLRFPAGNAGDEADLDAAVLDTFAAALPRVPGRPELMVQTRVYQGRDGRPAANGPEDAAQAVRLARERGLKVRYWEIGNEPDLYSAVRGDASWTPTRYCDVARAQAAAVRREQPGALISAPAVSGAVPAAGQFLEAFVRECGDVIDVLTWHIYPTEGDGSEADALATVSQVDQSLAAYRALWKDPVRNPLGHLRDIGFGVTEYGLSWRTERPRFLADQTGALWATEAALRLAAGGASVAHYFAYLTTGYHGLLDAAGVPRPTWRGFRMLAELRGHFIGATSSHPGVWAHATREGATVRTVLINTRTEPTTVRLSGAKGAVREARYFDAAIADSDDPLGRLPARERLTLPPRSATLVRLQLRP